MSHSNSNSPSLSQQQRKVFNVGGATDSIKHSIDEDEQEQFVLHINEALRNDADVGSRLPIDGKSFEALYAECKDGLVLSKLINTSVPDTIDERVMNKGKLNTFTITENQNVVINSAKAIGCSVVNIGAQDLIEGRPYLVLGLVWQIIKIGLYAKVDLLHHPELIRLLEEGETLDALLKLPTDQILLRWFNYHLKEAGHEKRVANFSGDIKDSEAYTVLLNQLKPDLCDRSGLALGDLQKRAESVLINAEKLGCRKYVTAGAIVKGNPKLNLAFVANLFNTHPGLAALTEQEKAALDEWLFNSQGDRESRAFALWMNSLGVDPFVNNLAEDLRDGLILLQTFDKVRPGSVDWKLVNKVAKTRFKMVENTNYAVVLGKSFKFSLVGIQGADLTDGVKNLTLGLVWQLMREHIIATLKSISHASGKAVTDADIVAWANEKVKGAGKQSQITGFRDSALKTSHFFLDLLDSCRKGIVDYKLVTPGNTEDEQKSNAKYAISVARKLGAVIFVLPEDIIEVKPKMMLTFVGAVMATNQ